MNARQSLLGRARAMLARPREEWGEIVADPGHPLIHAIALAGIPPFAGLIAATTHGALGEDGLAFALTRAGLLWLLVIATILAFAVLVLPFARDWRRALALAAYGSTAFLVAGAFGISPTLGFFTVLGFYSVWLIYLGARILLGASVAPALALAFGAGLAAWLAPPHLEKLATTASVRLGFAPDRAPPQMARNSAPSGAVAVDPARLKLLLPASIGAYARRDNDLELPPFANGVQGLYESEGRIFALRIADMADLGGAVATAPDEWNEAEARGQASALVGRRFLIVAAGQAKSLDELRAAVATVDPDDLNDLAE